MAKEAASTISNAADGSVEVRLRSKLHKIISVRIPKDTFLKVDLNPEHVFFFFLHRHIHTHQAAVWLNVTSYKCDE